MIVFFFILFAVLRFCDLRGGGDSSSRHRRFLLTAPHCGCALWGSTKLLPLRGRSRYMSPAHGTTLRSFVACAGLPSSCPFGAAQGRCLLLRAPHCAPSSLVRGYQALAPSGLLKVILHSQFSGPASFRTLRSCGVTSVKIFRCEKSRMAASTAPITSEMVQAAQMPVSPFSPALVNSTGTM